MKKVYLQLAAIVLATVCIFFFFSLPVSAQEGPGGEPPSGEGPPEAPPDGERPGDPPDGERPGDPPDGEGGGQGGPGGPGGPGGADTMTYDYDGTLSGALTASCAAASSGEFPLPRR